MSEKTLRLFVAVDPPSAAVVDLGAVVDTLEVARANASGRSTRLAARERWHVTLAFLGEVPRHRVATVTTALEHAVASDTVRTAVPIRVRVAGGGTFGRGKFAILWAGLGGDVAGLEGLARAVRRELKGARIPFDTKAFRPHITLSRPGGRVPAELIAADVATLSSYEGPLWSVEAVHLVHSTLGPQPRHTRLATVSLPSP